MRTAAAPAITRAMPQVKGMTGDCWGVVGADDGADRSVVRVAYRLTVSPFTGYRSIVPE